MKVRFSAPILDPSGYSQAARTYALAMLEAGIDLTLDPISFEPYSTGYGRSDAILAPLIDRELDWDTQVLMATPGWWHRMKKGGEGTRTVGITMWETSAMHPDWEKEIRSTVDELWLPSQFNVDAFQGALPGLPVRKAPCAIDLTDFAAHHDITHLEGMGKSTFVFFFTSQWTPRKGFEALINAYLAEFTPDDDVCLVLKTYAANNEPDQHKIVTQRVADLLRDTGIPSTELPKFKLVLELLSFRQMVGLHRRADCYVSPHCGEGWGLGIAEAMAVGTPVITVPWSGNLEFCATGCFYPVEYQMQFVKGMPWFKSYASRTGNVRQMWAQASEVDLAKTMRHVFDNRREAAQTGLSGQKNLAKFSTKAVGAHVRGLLENPL